jgi:hypothetical protein
MLPELPDESGRGKQVVESKVVQAGLQVLFAEETCSQKKPSGIYDGLRHG